MRPRARKRDEGLRLGEAAVVRRASSGRDGIIDALLTGGVTRDKAPDVGALLTASHVSMRDDFEITVPAVDTLAAALVAGGAYGACELTTSSARPASARSNGTCLVSFVSVSSRSAFPGSQSTDAS